MGGLLASGALHFFNGSRWSKLPPTRTTSDSGHALPCLPLLPSTAGDSTGGLLAVEQPGLGRDPGPLFDSSTAAFVTHSSRRPAKSSVHCRLANSESPISPPGIIKFTPISPAQYLPISTSVGAWQPGSEQPAFTTKMVGVADNSPPNLTIFCLTQVWGSPGKASFNATPSLLSVRSLSRSHPSTSVSIRANNADPFSNIEIIQFTLYIILPRIVNPRVGNAVGLAAPTSL
ncbi:hypothetical protein GGR57DRAFT_510124 [Xylariaceae sp. FL1272]|nr:hypothetical protein GGR57DRAFT_510124 [Xylariaceae sp. FL1272]